MKHFLFSILFFAATTGFAAEIQLGSPSTLAVRFDENTGELTAVVYQNDTITLPLNGIQWFDYQQNGEWIFAKNKPVLKSIDRISVNEVSITRTIGDWTILFHYEIKPAAATLKRSFELEYNGKEPTIMKSFWTAYPTFPFTEDSECFIPGQYPPRRYTQSDFAEGQRLTSGRNSAPLVFQINKNRSIILLSDNLKEYSDSPSSGIERRDGGVRLSQSYNIQGRVVSGTKFKLGDTYLRIIDGNSETALFQFHPLMKQLGHSVPKDRPNWFEEAILYSFHPGGTIGSNCKDLGGFKPATELLDRIKELGCNSIWLLPLEDRSIYWPRDYYKFQDGLGSTPEKAPEEYKALVNRAHELGINVLQDSVPHGGGNPNARSTAHPEWLLQDENGKTYDYWGFDFNHPTWIDYMSEVAEFYMKNYGIDGYRVDACGGSRMPNWNPDIPYSRASHSQSQGGLNMLRAIRTSVKNVNRNGGILAEVHTGIWGAVSDATYDFDLCYNVLHDSRKLPAEEFVNRIRRWLHEQQYSEIPDMLRLRHIESHDSLRSQLWYGTEGHRKLLALTAFIHGIPLVYHDQEIGNHRIYKMIFEARKSFSELNGGDADYLSIEAPPGVFACLRTKGEQASIVVIDFNEKPVQDVTLSLRTVVLPEKLRGGNTDVLPVWDTGRCSGSNDNGLFRITIPSVAPFNIIVLRTGEESRSVREKIAAVRNLGSPSEDIHNFDRSEIANHFAKKPGTKYYGSIYWRPQGVDHSEILFQAEDFIRQHPQAPLRCAIGGYVFENEYFKLRLTRSGTIMSLDKKIEGMSGNVYPIIQQGDIYTDYGYAARGTRYAAGNDVEAACRVVQDGDTLRIRFEGQLRGFGRFELIRNPVEFFIEYALKEGSSAFGIACGVKTNRVPAEAQAFLSLFLPLPNVEKFEYYDKDGKVIAEGSNIGANGRSFETKDRLPQRVVLKNAEKTLLTLIDLQGELANVFLDRKNFFITFDDNNAFAIPNRWRTCTATFLTEAESNDDMPKIRVMKINLPDNQANGSNVLDDGSFESVSASEGSSLDSSMNGVITIDDSKRKSSAWSIPEGGSQTNTEKHSGNTAAQVNGELGQYRLFTQDIPVSLLKAGAKLQLSAWVKGRELVKGTEDWQVGCVRFMVRTADGKMTYIAASSLLGTFDWRRVTVEYTVPENLQELRELEVQVGSNGASGVIWIDDVQVSVGQ